MGKLIDHTDEEGRPYREVDKKAAPEVGVEVRPDEAGSWDVRLTVHRFRFSPAGTAARAAVGRGLAHLLVDGRLVSRLRAPEFHLSARLVPHGTHHVTARLYADDGTVWAVSGKPVQSTADITASAPTPTPLTTASPAGTTRTATAGPRGGTTAATGTTTGTGATEATSASATFSTSASVATSASSSASATFWSFRAHPTGAFRVRCAGGAPDASVACPGTGGRASPDRRGTAS